MTTALRSFLGFARYRGEIDKDLAACVPAVANWKLSIIPRALPPDQVKQVLASIDRKTAMGRRDYAILLILARLGLRAGEIRMLTLEDLDWQEGLITVRGKAGRYSQLPLPVDVGTAIADYLRHGRPTASSRCVFLRAKAPAGGFRGQCGIGSIVRHALARAGIDAARTGAHQFRHALACQMLRQGASLSEIGELLRHRSPQTTAIYAKVDLASLAALALARRCTVTSWLRRVEEYVELRRSLGFKLLDAKVGLIKFASFLQQRRAVCITIPLAMEWAQQDKTARPADWAKRLSFVRGFARHWSAHDSQTEVPPTGMLPHRPRRAHPYLYSNEEVRKLPQAARRLPSKHGLRGRTYYCLLGLLAVAGLRISEARNLQTEDVDLEEGVLTIRGAKFGKSRLVPIHPSTRKVLSDYASRRDHFLSKRPVTFFVSGRGTRLDGAEVRRTFYFLVAADWVAWPFR